MGLYRRSRERKLDSLCFFIRHPTLQSRLSGAREEEVRVPAELEQYVIVFTADRSLNYVDYYRELCKLVSSIGGFHACVWAILWHTMCTSPMIQGLVLPILGSDVWNGYIRDRATAAFPAGVISRAPSLVASQPLKSYDYLETRLRSSFTRTEQAKSKFWRQCEAARIHALQGVRMGMKQVPS